jgi:probable phosphoglycerate mutase
MKVLGVMPDRVMHGPLKRTARAAELISAQAGWEIPREVNEALREIDYGAWEALSTEEIEALGGGAELAFWNKSAVWPKAPAWTALPEEILRVAGQIMADAAQRGGLTLAVTSNGIMRFFGMQIPEVARPSKLKVGTGNVCVLVHEGNVWRVAGWNVPPGEVEV